MTNEPGDILLRDAIEKLDEQLIGTWMHLVRVLNTSTDRLTVNAIASSYECACDMLETLCKKEFNYDLRAGKYLKENG